MLFNLYSKKRQIFMLAMTGVLLFGGCSSKSTEKQTVETIKKNVKTVSIESEAYVSELSYLGNISTSDIYNTSFQVGGKIQSIEVETGDYVKAGQVLAQIDTADYQLAVDNDEKNIDLIYNSRKINENAIEKIKSGIEAENLTIEKIKSGIEAENLTLEKIEISIESQKITLQKIIDTYDVNISGILLNYEQKKSDYENAKVLLDSGAISKSDYDNLKLLFEATEKEFLLAQSNRDSDIALQEQAIKNAENDLALQKQAIKNAENDLALQYMAIKTLEQDLESAYLQLEAVALNVEQAEISLEQNLRTIENAILTSPIDGYVMNVTVKEGDLVNAGTPVVIVRTDDVLIKTAVPAEDYKKVYAGMPVNIETLDANISGTISKISQHPDTESRTYSVEIIADDMENLILESIVTINIPIEENKGYFIPINAILTLHGVHYVYKITYDNNNLPYVTLQEVVLGITVNDRVVVENLTEPILIVSEGIRNIQENDIVMIVD